MMRSNLVKAFLAAYIFVASAVHAAPPPAPIRLAAEQGSADAQFKLGLIYYEGTWSEGRNYPEAMKWFIKAADQKNPHAADYIGVMYQNGDGVPQDYAQAIKWYKTATGEGSSYSLVFLGELSESGEGTLQDYAQAMMWYKRASEEAKSARAEWHLGLMYADGKGVKEDYAEAIKWEKKAADANYLPAIVALGKMYYEHENYPEAVKWWIRAGRQNDIDAQNYLGAIYHEGKEGVPHDDTAAAAWYKAAAKQGNANAQNKLSLMYYDGEGMPRDYVLSYVWASFSAAQGDAVGKKAINDLEVIMSPDQLAESQRMAREWQGQGEHHSFFER